MIYAVNQRYKADNAGKNNIASQLDFKLIRKKIKQFRQQFDSVVQKQKKHITFPKIIKQQPHSQSGRHLIDQNYFPSTLQRSSKIKLISTIEDPADRYRNRWPQKNKVNLSLDIDKGSDLSNKISKACKKRTDYRIDTNANYNDGQIKNELSRSINNISVVKKKKGTDRLRRQKNINTYRNPQQKYGRIVDHSEIDISSENVSPSNNRDRGNSAEKPLLPSCRVREAVKIKNNDQQRYIELCNLKDLRSLKTAKQSNPILGLQQGLLATKNKLDSKQMNEFLNEQDNLNRRQQLKKLKQEISLRKQERSLQKKQKKREKHYNFDIGSYILVFDKDKKKATKQKISQEGFTKQSEKFMNPFNFCNSKIWNKSLQPGSQKKDEIQNIYTPWNFQNQNQQNQIELAHQIISLFNDSDRLQ